MASIIPYSTEKALLMSQISRKTSKAAILIKAIISWDSNMLRLNSVQEQEENQNLIRKVTTIRQIRRLRKVMMN